LNGESFPSGHLVVDLVDKYSLSIVNNSHAFSDEWEGAATLEVAMLKDGRLICGEDDYTELTIINGIDYHKLANLFKQVRKNGPVGLFRFWVECYRLTDSRFEYYDEEFVADIMSRKEYFADVKKAIYA
jgi:hypothetical protein